MKDQIPTLEKISTDIPDPFEGGQPYVQVLPTTVKDGNFTQTHRHSDTQTLRHADTQDVLPPLFSPYQAEINRHIPTEPHNNNRCMFRVCQVLRTVERENKRKAKQHEVRQLFDYWASKSQHLFRPELTYEDYFAEFWRIFDATTCCHDESPLEIAFENAKKAPPPPGTENIESEDIRQLARFCLQISLITRGEFYLSCRDAAKYFPKVSYRTLATRLGYLERLGIIRRVKKGSLSEHKASVYEYLTAGEPEEHPRFL